MSREPFDPSVVVSFRVKVDSPLFKWLKNNALDGESISDAVRAVMENFEARELETQRFLAFKRGHHYYNLLRNYHVDPHDRFREWVRKRKLDYDIDSPSPKHILRELRHLMIRQDSMYKTRESYDKLFTDKVVCKECVQRLINCDYERWLELTPFIEEEE